MDDTLFITSVTTPRDRAQACLLIDSLRAFGGDLASCPVWVFEANPEGASCDELGTDDVAILPLRLPETIQHYHFAAKVWACAWAEDLMASHTSEPTNGRVRTLAWLAPDCLVIQPPALYQLGPEWDAAVRPVHIQNVGLRPGQSLDPFWRRAYAAVGVQDLETTVESFVDGQQLRAYFNSHGFAVDPGLGLLRRWADLFRALVLDGTFQAAGCQDVRHQIFLHQAVLSALLATAVDPARLRLLPPTYNYPYNLHASVPEDRRAQALNDLVCIAYEDRSLDPGEMGDIAVEEPLRSWLAGRRQAKE
jgi:hypothetical protein